MSGYQMPYCVVFLNGLKKGGDALEKDRLRKKMAQKIGVFLEGAPSLSCVSCHIYSPNEPHFCDLCQNTHAEELFVVKNRSGKKMHVAVPCFKEMVKFRVVDLDNLVKWLQKLEELKAEAIRREADAKKTREEQKKILEKKVMIRKKQY